MTLGGFLDVSRETMERLERYSELLVKWNPRINLVSKSTIDDLWTRHILDSAQIFEIPKGGIRRWVDLGSGGGFPGLVVAVLVRELEQQFEIMLVESDARKCAFLSSVARELDLKVQIKNDRIENLNSLDADIVSARALADLSSLLDLSERHLAQGATLLLMKGKKWRSELETAQSKWNFDCQIVKSKTSEGSVILCVSGVCRV
ncbi:16S rRNA (guanine(527)-N(7))-methyltransferase RsmG [Roseovarius rhodophyticola]|uniref:Ribosomal RNA small subunit methyltransferase G n=1 Tax=Roseovarius rhodophyticola TaxID=3080827 RepID=A0ABZ2TJK9_9RHOB|nr:16S rRNA (guanine(527)-N(7))-methyltransferase RsmG [Roseovarius sp. W115]MDV2930063.1 16S rRNA (guanine(527)-N(7))-methyltransferase RsmG [Roseovarius sp. W115]